MSYTELRRLPTSYRHWYLERLNKHFKDINSSKDEKQNESIGDNIKKIDQFIDRLKK